MARIVENALVVYTDGSLKWKGRKGGYRAVFVHIDGVGNENVVLEYQPPGVIGTTGNRMELQAVIDAICLASDCACYPTIDRVVIRSDSRYVTDNYQKAVYQWSKRRWAHRDGRPIDNPDLWKEFVRRYRNSGKRLEIEWIRGHGKGRGKDPYNYAADKLADASARSPLSRRQYRSSVRRRLSPFRTKRGSIKAEGQTLAIHVIETERMRVHRTWKYRCEVLTEKSPYYQCVDWLYSDEQLRDGHFYEVRLNDSATHPQILELMQEFERGDPSESVQAADPD